MIIIIGIAGSGKSIQCQKIIKTHDYHWLSVGEYLRNHESIKELTLMNKGQMLPDDEVISAIKIQILSDKSKEVLLDGFPRRVAQTNWLIELHNTHQITINNVILLQLDLETALQRLEARHRTDDNIKAIAKRFNIFNTSIKYIMLLFQDNHINVNYVDANQSIEHVYKDIITIIEAN